MVCREAPLQRSPPAAESVPGAWRAADSDGSGVQQRIRAKRALQQISLFAYGLFAYGLFAYGLFAYGLFAYRKRA